MTKTRPQRKEPAHRAKRRQPHEMLLSRLGEILSLSNAETAAVADLPLSSATILKGTDLVVSGEEGTRPFIVLDGWLIEHRVTAEGARQVLDILIASNLGNMRAMILPAADVFISAATEVRVAYFTADDFHGLVQRHPRLSTALFWMVALRRSRFFEHMVSLGRRKAHGRIGHFIAELFVRAKSAGLAGDRGFSCPLRLADIADFVGLTPEHVSRVMAQLRREGLVEITDAHFVVNDMERLMSACGIDTAYLHLDEKPLMPKAIAN